jgi:hypothetical protein
MRRAGHAKPVQEEVHRTDYPDLEDNHSRIGEVVKKARNHMDAHPRAALAGARLVCRDFSSRPSAVRFPRLVSDALVLTGPAAKYSRSGFLHIWTGPRQTPCNPPGTPRMEIQRIFGEALVLTGLAGKFPKSRVSGHFERTWADQSKPVHQSAVQVQADRLVEPISAMIVLTRGRRLSILERRPSSTKNLTCTSPCLG